MPGWDVLAPFLVAVVVVQVTPGPGMLFILANGIAGGPRAGVAAALGAASGMVVHTVAAAAGLAAVFHAAPPLYDAVRLAGAGYLFWLAITHLRSAGRLSDLDVMGGQRSLGRIYVRAVLNNLANPKVILFFAAFLPQFVVPQAGSALVQFLVLGVIFLLVGLALDLVIGLSSGRIGQRLRESRWIAKLLDRLSGTIFAALGLRLALSDDRP